MSKLKPNFFLDSIAHLRAHGHLIISDDLLKTTKQEDEDIVLYLEQDFEKECLSFPFEAPRFNANAALWASKIVYYASLLLLHRKDTKKDLETMFADYTGVVDLSTILSVDLTLRFLPQIFLELEAIDPQDPLVIVLKQILNTWQFSAIHQTFKAEDIDKHIYLNTIEIKQVFLNRIVDKKAINWAHDAQINSILIDYLGYYKNDIWKALQPIKTTNEH
jgi:hypothetical protein|nr:hypothetical protein [uncultured Psychroserpens sp.]